MDQATHAWRPPASAADAHSQVMGGSLATKSVRYAFQIMEELRSRNASGA